MTTATGAACIVVGGEEIFEETAGLMDNIEFGFDTLAALTVVLWFTVGSMRMPIRETCHLYFGQRT